MIDQQSPSDERDEESPSHDRRGAEKQWHERFFHSRRGADLVVSDSIRKRYFHPPNPELFPLEKMFELAGDVRRKNVLCFGCGDENSTVLLALKGAEVWAFDLSVEAIEVQRAMALANGVADRIHLIVCAAEELAFRDAIFDVVFGSAILHHLPDSVPKAVQELGRVMRPDAFALFSEPVERNRWMRRLRKLFPTNPELSPGERKLTDEDLQPFFSSFRVEVFPYNLLARLLPFLETGPFERVPNLSASFRKALRSTDDFLFRIWGMHRLAGVVVFRAFLSKHA